MGDTIDTAAPDEETDLESSLGATPTDAQTSAAAAAKAAGPIPPSPLLSGGPVAPADPWSEVFKAPRSDPWAEVFKPKPTAPEPVVAGQNEAEFHRSIQSYKNVGNAFLVGLGDGWTGGAIVPADQPWGLPKEWSQGLDQWLSYPKIKDQEQTTLQAFNEGFLFPAVKGLADIATRNAQMAGSVAQVPLQAGSALLSGVTHAIVQGGVETGHPQLARDIAADLERRAIGGGEPIGIHLPEGVERPTPEQAITEFRTEPFPTSTAEQFGPREAPVTITPDIITQARDLGVLGSQEEWDGTSVYSRVPASEAAPDLRTIHHVAREIDPDTFLEYDRLSAMRDNARQALTDEVGRLRDNAEAEIEANAPHTDEIADLKDTLADPRSSARSKRDATVRLPGLEAAQEAYLADQDRYAFLTRETPETAALRREVVENDERMRDLAPQVSAAYREAANRVPPEPEAAPVVAPEATSPPPGPTPATSVPFEAAPVESTPPLDIAAHVADRLTRAGRPPEEGRALGALADAYYTTWGQRLGIAPADLYRAEAPQIVGRATGGTAAGMLERTNGRSLLTLFNRADATTAIHEFGHQWFNDLLRFSERDGVPGNIKADAAVVRRWLGVEEGQPLTRRHQERVARAFENYMMEGHAPSTGLKRVFEQFRDWMTKVYETVRQQNVPLNDDLRGVFDRWFSTEPVPRETVVAPEKAGPPPKPRIIGQIMRDERVRESVARQIQSQEIIAYSDWQAANRNAGTNATTTPPPVEALAPGERPRTPRPIAQIIAEDRVGPGRAQQIQGEEYVALSEWQAAQRAAGKPTVPAGKPASPVSLDVAAIARDILKPKAMPEAVPVEPVTATPLPEPEPYVPKNFGPEAKPIVKPSPAYVRVPREPKRLTQFLKEGVKTNEGTAAEQVTMRGLMPEPNGVQQLQSVLNGKKGVINVRDGEPLDHARERAVEAGYFPQGAEGVNDLYEALSADTSGQPRYSMFDDDKVSAYEQAVKHNREIDRLAAEHDIDPRGMTLQAFTKAIEDKVGKEEFDAKALIERARAIDEANEMRDDLTHWHDSEAEHAGRLDEHEFDRLWGEASASQELVDRRPGDGEPGVPSRSTGQGPEGAGSERGGAGVSGPTEPTGAGGTATGATAEPAGPGGAAGSRPEPAAGGPTAKPEPFPVTKPGPGLEEQIKRRAADIPKVGNIRLEYILDGKWDELVAEVMSELSLSGDPRVRAGSVRTMAEHAIFNATADEFYKAKSAWQATPTEANWGTLLTAKANHAAATASWSTGLTNWAYTGHTYQRIIREGKRIEAEMKAAGEAAPPDQQTLFQRQQEMAALDNLNTPEQVGHALMRDMTTRWDRIRDGMLAFYMSNILSGPVTHAGYLIGGVINNVLQPLLVIPTQAAIGAVRGGGTMDRVMFGEAPAAAYGLVNGAMKGVAPAIRAFKTGDVTMEGQGRPSPYQQQILPTLLGGIPGKILETPLRAIRAIHIMNYSMRFTAEVSRMAYRDAMKNVPDGSTATEFGAAVQRYINNLPEDDMKYAHDEAIRAALMKPPGPGSTQAAVSGLLQNQPLLRLIAPFPQIGMNLAEEGLVRTTPFGLLNKNVRGDLAAGGARFDVAAGRMAAGSGIAAGVVGLALNGLITGPGPDQSTAEGRNQRRLLEAKGWAPFALRWGDSYIPLKKALGPLGELVGVTATLANAGTAAAHGEFRDAAAKVSQGFAAAVLDETWLRGIHDVFDAATHADQKLGYYLTNLAEGFVPFSQFMSQTARQVDPYTRQANGFIEHLMARTPFVSERLEPQIGPFGDPVLGHSTMGIHAILPAPVADRMLALGMGATPFPRDIKGVPMTEAQKTAYGTLAGHLERQLLTPLVTAPGFDQLPAGMQIKQIDKRIARSREDAAKVVQAANPEIIAAGVLLKRKILLEGRAGAVRR